MTTRPPPADPSASPDPPDTRQTSPPTVSYRHPEFEGGPSVPLTGTRRSPVRGPLAEPSSSDLALHGPEAQLPVLVQGIDEQRALLSVTTKSPVSPARTLDEADINTTQRSTDGPLSPRLFRDDGRTSRLEEQLSLLDARLRLVHKATVRLERMVVAALLLGALALGFALFW